MTKPITLNETERFDKLAHDACRHVFQSMADENVEFVEASTLVGAPERGSDLLAGIEEMRSGVYTIAVGYQGDAEGRISLTLSKALAEKFALRVLDVSSLDWLGEDPQEVLADTLGELGNATVGLIKGGLTRLFPRLMLTTPRVVVGKRFRVDNAALSFRKQYHFRAMGSSLLVDFCHR